jgi:hypothetical protein
VSNIKDQSVNTLQGKNRCLLLESYGTYKVNTLCGQSAGLLNVTAGGACRANGLQVNIFVGLKCIQEKF